MTPRRRTLGERFRFHLDITRHAQRERTAAAEALIDARIYGNGFLIRGADGIIRRLDPAAAVLHLPDPTRPRNDIGQPFPVDTSSPEDRADAAERLVDEYADPPWLAEGRWEPPA